MARTTNRQSVSGGAGPAGHGPRGYSPAFRCRRLTALYDGYGMQALADASLNDAGVALALPAVGVLAFARIERTER